MKVDAEVISPIRRRLKILVPEEVVRKELDQAYSTLQKRAEIKGFRKGKAPRSLLERLYKDQVEYDVVNKVIKESYNKAIQELSISPVSQPIIEEGVTIKTGEDLHYSAIVEVKPSFQVKGYLDLQLKERVPSVRDDEVERKLEGIRDLHSYLKEIEEERPLGEGDLAIVDFEGKIDGRPFPGGKGNDQVVAITRGVKEEGFPQRLIGMRRGETREFDVDFPPDYPKKEVAGRKVHFKVLLKGIKEKILPGLNDDFAREVGKFGSLEELKEKIREDILEEKRREIQREYRREILDQLVQKNPIEVPEALVESQMSVSFAITERHLARQGINMERLDLDDPRFLEEMRNSSRRVVQEDLILEAIADSEGIEVTEEDLNKVFHELSITYGESVERVRERYFKREEDLKNLKSRIRGDKTLDFLIARAKIITGDDKN